MGHLLKFVQIVWFLVKVKPQQFSLQTFYESFTAEEIPDDAVRERVALQLQISCTYEKKPTERSHAAWDVYK